MVCMSCLVSSRPCMGPRGGGGDEKQAWVSEDSWAYGGMCSGERDHREHKAFHTHYSYLSSSWKAKKSQVEGMTASDSRKREACC